jgi:hypothetical protein
MPLAFSKLQAGQCIDAPQATASTHRPAGYDDSRAFHAPILSSSPTVSAIFYLLTILRVRFPPSGLVGAARVIALG